MSYINTTVMSIHFNKDCQKYTNVLQDQKCLEATGLSKEVGALGLVLRVLCHSPLHSPLSLFHFSDYPLLWNRTSHQRFLVFFCFVLFFNTFLLLYLGSWTTANEIVFTQIRGASNHLSRRNSSPSQDIPP